MRRLRAAVWRLFGSFTGARRDRQLADELESHLRLHIADNIRSGMSPADAGGHRAHGARPPRRSRAARRRRRRGNNAMGRAFGRDIALR
ncbi:MAG: permease prefix domain 1-containing protein, partial [Vicinamibacteraceae bacterium]